VQGFEPAAHSLRRGNADRVVTFPELHHALVGMKVAMHIAMADGKPQALPYIHLQQNFVGYGGDIRLTINSHFSLSVFRYKCAKNAAITGAPYNPLSMLAGAAAPKTMFHLCGNCTTQSDCKSIGLAIG